MLWPRLLPLAALPDQDIDIPCDVFDKDQDDDDGEKEDNDGEFKFLREEKLQPEFPFCLSFASFAKKIFHLSQVKLTIIENISQPFERN